MLYIIYSYIIKLLFKFIGRKKGDSKDILQHIVTYECFFSFLDILFYFKVRKYNWGKHFI